MPQGSILGLSLFLIYVSETVQSVSSDLLLFADDSCLAFQHKHVTIIETHLNNHFSNLCEWFLDNKLSIHSGEDKTKSIPFGTKRKFKKAGKLNITYQGIDIKQNLTPRVKRLLCNTLIQPQFDYATTVWYPNFNKKLKNKIQTTQNKCVRFCLNLDKMTYMSQNEFERLNWHPITDIINQCVLSTTSKFVNDIGINYLNKVLQWATESNRTLRNDYRKLKHPFRKTAAGQNSLSFLGPSKWNKLPESTKNLNNINTFKYNFKKRYLAQLSN